jgi:hypothetical protein
LYNQFPPKNLKSLEILFVAIAFSQPDFAIQRFGRRPKAMIAVEISLQKDDASSLATNEPYDDRKRCIYSLCSFTGTLQSTLGVV